MAGLTAIVWTLYFMEAYHAIAHFLVLTGWKRLPRKDLVNVKYYFLTDALTVALAFLFHQNSNFLPFFILQQWQHSFYFFTWDESKAAKRVISWSSLDWDRGRWNQVDLVVGTAFDLSCHLANMYFLSPQLSVWSMLIACVISVAATRSFLLHKRFAWSSKDNMPDWVARRVKPLTEDQRQAVPLLDKLAE